MEKNSFLIFENIDIINGGGNFRIASVSLTRKERSSGYLDNWHSGIIQRNFYNFLFYFLSNAFFSSDIYLILFYLKLYYRSIFNPGPNLELFIKKKSKKLQFISICKKFREYFLIVRNKIRNSKKNR